MIIKHIGNFLPFFFFLIGNFLLNNLVIYYYVDSQILSKRGYNSKQGADLLECRIQHPCLSNITKGAILVTNVAKTCCRSDRYAQRIQTPHIKEEGQSLQAAKVVQPEGHSHRF